jgi:hypothetical protein
VTDVRFEYTKPTASGQEVPLKVLLRFALLHRMADGTGTILTNWFDQKVEGPTIVKLLPTTTGQAWQMIEIKGTVARPGVQTFLVPDVPGVLEYEDLVFVDPESLNPVSTPLPVWEIELNELKARVAELEAQIAQG